MKRRECFREFSDVKKIVLKITEGITKKKTLRENMEISRKRETIFEVVREIIRFI